MLSAWRERATAIACWVAALIMPLALVIYWNLVQQSLPRLDAAEYLLAAQRLYDAVKDESVLTILGTAYLERNWRGILSPVLTLPFVALTGGDLLRAVAIKAVAFHAAFLTYTYLFAQQFATRLRAVLWTYLVGTIPFVVTLGTGRSELAEGVFFVALAASLYHGARSELFGSMRHTVLTGIGLGLAACCRPLEAVVLGLTAGAIFVPAALLRGRLRGRDIAVGVPLVTTAAVLLVWMSFRGDNHVSGDGGWLGVVLLVASVAAVPAGRRLGLSLPFLSGLWVGLAIVLVWWLPYAGHVYGWWRHGTVGAGEASGRSSLDLMAAVIRVVPDVFPYTFIALLIWGLLTRSAVHESERTRSSRLMVIYLSATFLTAISAGLLSPFIDPRFFFGGGLALIWLTFLILPSRNRALECVLAAGALLQLGAICSVAFDGALATKDVLGSVVPLNVVNENSLRLFRERDPQRRLFDAITSRLPPSSAGTVAVLPSAIDLDLQLDGHVLTLIGGNKWHFETPWVPPNTALELATLRNYDYVVVGPIEGTLSPWWPVQSRTGARLGRAWSLGKLDEIGFRFISRFTIQYHRRTEGTYLILKPNPHDAGAKDDHSPHEGISTGVLW